MSAGHIDHLLQLWAASLAKHNDDPPFRSHEDLYETIDATTLGDVKWESFSVKYNGSMPNGEVPPWMESKYDVWYRDPCTVIKNLLANPDFDNEFDYSPVREYDGEGGHRFHNFMTGDWSWHQAVCYILHNTMLESHLSFVPEHHCGGVGGDTWINACPNHFG